MLYFVEQCQFHGSLDRIVDSFMLEKNLKITESSHKHNIAKSH